MPTGYSKLLNPDTGEIDILSYILGRRGRDDEEEESDEEIKADEKKSRKFWTRKNPKESGWWIDYVLNERGLFNDPKTPHYRKFTNRFVVDQPQLMEICQAIKNLPEEKKIWTDKTGKSTPIEILVMGALRVLARNWTFDDVEESSGASAEVHRVFFPKFCKWYAEDIAPQVIKMPDPQNEEEFRRNCAEYIAACFPLCLGSIDVVHIRQWLCSANLKNQMVGKEHYPSRAYEVLVNHRKLILNVTQGFYGATNDKTIVRFDKAAMDLKAGKYAHFEQEVFDAKGEKKLLKGAYMINDNGYHKWSTMMEPSKTSKSDNELSWSEMLESLRKDVECVFGILKQMFAI